MHVLLLWLLLRYPLYLALVGLLSRSNTVYISAYDTTFQTIFASKKCDADQNFNSQYIQVLVL